MSDGHGRPAEREFGASVRRLREERGLTQEELADLVDIHQTYLSQLERGRKSPSLWVILRLSHALGVRGCEIVCAVEDALGPGPPPRPPHTPVRRRPGGVSRTST